MSAKRQARIERAVEKRLKEKEKSARLVAQVTANLPPRRVVRLGADPSSIYQMHMEWTDEHADREDAWSWGPRDWGQADWDRIIEPKLQSFQTMLWREIEAAVTGNGHYAHHSMAVESICDECQTRLLELEKVDGDIYRFRLGNRRRLWGFRVLQVFEILWYDPLHQVYPTEPD